MPIDLKPTAEMAANARRGLELRRKHGRGGLSTQEAARQGIGSGVARAASLANRQNLSPDTVKRMKSYFARHAVDKQGEGWGSETNPSAGYIAWLLWGGDAGRAWAERKVEEMEQGTQQAAEVTPGQEFADISGQMSYGDMREMLEGKLRERYRPPMMGTSLEYAVDGPHLMDFGDGQCVARMEGQYFRYPYQMQGRDCSMGEPVPVRLSWEDLEEEDDDDEPALMSEPGTLHPFAIELYTQTFAEAETAEIEVCRDGEWEHPKYGKVVVNRALRDSFIANFTAKVVKMNELPLDYDHEPGAAPGWIVGLKNVGKRLMAIVKPTPSGREKVRSGEYRFFSPEWHPNYRDPQSGQEYGPTLLRGALTNRPFFKGMEPVQFSEVPPESAGNDGAPAARSNPMSNPQAGAGVEPGASVDPMKFADLERQFAELKAARDADQTRLQMVEAENTRLMAERTRADVRSQVESLTFSEGKVKIAPAGRDKLTDVLVKLSAETRAEVLGAVKSLQFAELGERGGFLPQDESQTVQFSEAERRLMAEDAQKTGKPLTEIEKQWAQVKQDRQRRNTVA